MRTSSIVVKARLLATCCDDCRCVYQTRLVCISEDIFAGGEHVAHLSLATYIKVLLKARTDLYSFPAVQAIKRLSADELRFLVSHNLKADRQFMDAVGGIGAMNFGVIGQDGYL